MADDMTDNTAGERLRLGARGALSVATVVISLASAVGLAALYGYGDLSHKAGGFASSWGAVLVAAQMALAAALAGERFVRLALSGQPAEYVRRQWLDFAMIAVTASAVSAACVWDCTLSAGALWVVIAQVYVLFTLVLRAAEGAAWLIRGGVHPAWLLVGGMVVLCVGGAVLLMLPGAAAPNAARLWFHNALFTAISAATLTGLSLRPIGSEFSFFGQVVILGLIQAGGLMIMTFGLSLARQIGRRLCGGTGVLRGEGVSPSCPAGILPASGCGTDATYSVVKANGSHNAGGTPASRWAGEMALLAGFVVVVTLVIELIGAALIFPMFHGQLDALGRPLSAAGAAWYAVFHSVSAFCNAGFGLYDDSLRSFRESWRVLGVFGPLIVLGGIGLPVIQEVLVRVRSLPGRLSRARRLGVPVRVRRLCRLSPHGKVVLWTTLLLLFFGTTTLLLVETIGMTVKPAEPGRNFGVAAEARTEFQGMSASDRLRACAMLSVSSRTGGMRTNEIGQISDAGKAVLCVLMAVGGSPGSAAGGMKTVTFAVLFVVVWAGLGGRGRAEIFGRSVGGELVHRAVTLAGLYAATVCVVSIVLAVVVRSHGRFLDVLFESVSACSNAGLSTGATANVNDAGKFVLMFAMFVGRLAPMVFLLIVIKRCGDGERTLPQARLAFG
ncbi:MAG: hypothetical protein FWE88_05650 [Phycisphaerae bacterium]|nr:hypothetical protein [Phycisphaerae bacterium]